MTTYKQAPLFQDYWNQILCIVSKKLQVDMFAIFSIVNFYKQVGVKDDINIA
jgi:hypothetical protein